MEPLRTLNSLVIKNSLKLACLAIEHQDAEQLQHEISLIQNQINIYYGENTTPPSG